MAGCPAGNVGSIVSFCFLGGSWLGNGGVEFHIRLVLVSDRF